MRRGPLALVADDDNEVCEMIRLLLESQGMRVQVAPDTDKLQRLLREETPRVLIVDWYLPKRSGLEVIKSLRQEKGNKDIGVILISGKATMPQDTVVALESGADDYLFKPFDPRILLARVQALIRRQIWMGAGSEEDSVLSSGKLQVQLLERRVLAGERPVSLTRLEFELLVYFLRNPQRTLGRRELLEAVWKYPDDLETRTVDKHVENIRRKLGSIGKRVETVPTIGYRLVD
ncbi:MAG: response regulator transcription factor [Elusimicrobia bacterium]|nr:response regulator transcription factor [Elusimicrobiota bacterium]